MALLYHFGRNASKMAHFGKMPKWPLPKWKLGILLKGNDQKKKPREKAIFSQNLRFWLKIDPLVHFCRAAQRRRGPRPAPRAFWRKRQKKSCRRTAEFRRRRQKFRAPAKNGRNPSLLCPKCTFGAFLGVKVMGPHRSRVDIIRYLENLHPPQ